MPVGMLGMFEQELLGFPDSFGKAEFVFDADITELKYVLSIADCWISILDPVGLSDFIEWAPVPVIRDPPNFRAGGIHTPEAVQYWLTEIPDLAAWPRKWVTQKVFFPRKTTERTLHHARCNAACVTRGHPDFDFERFQFLDLKIKAYERTGAVLQLADEEGEPEVICRLNVVAKALSASGEGDAWRVIIDMRPENSEYKDLRCKLEHLLHFQDCFSAGDMLISLDLKSAYHHCEVHPALARRMGFKWCGKCYIFLVIPFGFKLSPYTFIKLTRQFIKKWRRFGPAQWRQRFPGAHRSELKRGAKCQQYIDDSAAGNGLFVVLIWQRNAMIYELERLGFSLSAKGELLPLQVLRFLGLLAHFACPVPRWHVPADKVASIMQVAQGLLDRSHAAPLRSVGKCVGKLVSVSRAVPASRLMSRALNAAIYSKGSPDWSSEAVLPDDALLELRFILTALAPWNRVGSPIFTKSMMVEVELDLVQDAGPIAAGFAILSQQSGQLLAAGTILLDDTERAQLHHVHKELWGLLLTLVVKGSALLNRRIRVQVDSTTTVAYLRNFGGPSELLTAMVKIIWAVCVRYSITLAQVEHISGERMVANGVNARSRPQFWRRSAERDQDEWRLKRTVVGNLQVNLQVHFTVDRMANRANAVVARFTSLVDIDMRAHGLFRFKPGAFANDWNLDAWGRREVNYCFPPLRTHSTGPSSCS
jgi:hypothetical protein